MILTETLIARDISNPLVLSEVLMTPEGISVSVDNIKSPLLETKACNE